MGAKKEIYGKATLSAQVPVLSQQLAKYRHVQGLMHECELKQKESASTCIHATDKHDFFNIL